MIVPSLIAADDRIAGVAEDIDVGVAYQLVDLHIGSVIRSQGDGSVQHEFHISRAAGFLGGQGDLFGDIAGRDQLFCQSHVVIIYHHYI